MSFSEFVAVIKTETDPKIEAVAKDFDRNPRHTFVVGAFIGATPVVSIISNYESGGETRAKALPELQTEHYVARPEAKGAMILSGASVPKSKSGRLFDKIKAGASAEAIIAGGTKLIRDASFGKGRSGKVGSSVLVGQWPQFGGGASQLRVTGGTTIMEAPNFITPGAKWTNIHFGGPTERQRLMQAGQDVSHMEFGITEHCCHSCNSPVPEGYRKCGVCGSAQARPT